MKKIMIGICCVALLYWFFPTKITGDTYVLTNSRLTIPMPLVEVKAYDYDAFTRFLDDAKHFSTINCGAVLSQNELLELELKILTGGPKYRIKHQEAENLAKQCSLSHVLNNALTLKPLAQTMTDKEGRFTLSLSRNDVVLVAQSHRNVIGDTEFYTWLKPVKFGLGMSEKADLDNSANVNHLAIHEIKI